MGKKRDWNKGFHRLWLVYTAICVLMFMFGLGQTAWECPRATGCGPLETFIGQRGWDVGGFAWLAGFILAPVAISKATAWVIAGFKRTGEDNPTQHTP